MVKVFLNPISESDFPSACRKIVEGFASLIQASRGLTSAAAFAESKDQIGSLIPSGMHTPLHHFFHVQQAEAAEPVGLIWVQANAAKQRAFLYWIEIFPPYRGQQQSDAALRALERWLLTQNITLLNLEVFRENTRALALYQRTGFTQLGYVLQKELTHS